MGSFESVRFSFAVTVVSSVGAAAPAEAPVFFTAVAGLADGLAETDGPFLATPLAFGTAVEGLAPFDSSPPAPP